MIPKLAALALLLSLSALGAVCLRRNLRGEHIFGSLSVAGFRWPIWFELTSGALFLLVCLLFTLIVAIA
ncbi:hypothetical protein [Sphingopyxis fribergensis]|uniref:hypothetical protein n=1 Tax=Sphingopyxis fribergensis TaxID=1515612 RepID=UPI00057F9C42|nr:hypothetical protein [Sphingopyxis fribergensis]